MMIEELLNDPQVLKVTDHVNEEVVERRQYKPPICDAFSKSYTFTEPTDEFQFEIDPEARRKLPNIIHNKVQQIRGTDSPDESVKAQYAKARNIGIVFSGGPAPGGHNVIAGLYDAAKKANPQNKIFGFLMGPDGIMENEAVELTHDRINEYRNMGGFTMIKTGRAKIDTDKKMSLSRETCKDMKLDALVVVGGDDSNTNAAFLAQEMFHDRVQVIGVPKTIDGDIQVRDRNGNILCAMSFGFHSAARAFAGSISNLCTDGCSDVKYWHICKVMGRVASYLALEVALQTHANMTFIGEDLANYTDPKRLEKSQKDGTTDYTAYGMTLRHLSRVICDGIVRRAAVGKNYGVMVIPEGVLEFINEIQVFIIKLNTIIAMYNRTHDTKFHSDFPTLEDKMDYLRKFERHARESGDIAVWNSRDMDLFNDLPDFFKEGLFTERDSHGNFQFSLVETDKIVMGLVKNYLRELRENGIYKVGIHRDYYKKILKKEGLDPDFYGNILFRNYGEEYLMVRRSIISAKTLTQALVKGGAIAESDKIPSAIEKIYKKSVPSFSTQLHFYGYDGRGSNPTRFDCTYTYNLGLSVFSLIASGVTGQMAAIRNLEMPFDQWEPIGIPIAPLMHLEERGGKLSLVIEKSVVDVNSVAFKVVKALREKWLAASPGDDNYRHPGPIRLCEQGEEDRPIMLTLNALRRK
jgi:pyrophosphate--fructose-6-phosphate 1-phosphotransferase